MHSLNKHLLKGYYGLINMPGIKEMSSGSRLLARLVKCLPCKSEGLPSTPGMHVNKARPAAHAWGSLGRRRPWSLPAFQPSLLAYLVSSRPMRNKDGHSLENDTCDCSLHIYMHKMHPLRGKVRISEDILLCIHLSQRVVPL